MAKYIVDDRAATKDQQSSHGLVFNASFSDESITFQTKDKRIVKAWRIDGGYGARILAEVQTKSAADASTQGGAAT